MSLKRLPYFDFLLAQLAKENTALTTSFGRHVHWGYWEHPESATCDHADYGRAAECLTQELCAIGGIQEGERVLDAGCGFGGTLASINERFDAMTLWGLNIDGRQLQRAQGMVKAQKRNELAFSRGDACELPYGNGAFDRVLAVECIFHFPSRERFFREAARVLRPGGVLALSDFVPSGMFRPIAAGFGSSELFARFNYFGHCDVSCTLAQYRRIARAAGLVPVVERNVTDNILPTYRYLNTLLSKGGAMEKGATALIHLLRLLGRWRQLNYYLLAFRKP